MKYVLKIGGSLIQHVKELQSLGKIIAELGKRHQIIVVPGGAGFTDLVREIDQVYHLRPTTSHWMAIHGMSQYGYLLSDLIPSAQLVEKLNQVSQVLKAKQVVIFLPLHHMLEADPFLHSWEVTSDTIAAYVAKISGISQVILLKDIDGIFPEDPKVKPDLSIIEEITAQNLIDEPKLQVIDATLAKFLLKEQMSCVVLNGLYPQRLIDLVEQKQVISTTITG